MDLALALSSGLVLSAATAFAALQAWQRQRLVRYHHHKGSRVPPVTWSDQRREWVGLARIVAWQLLAFGADGIRHPDRPRGSVVLCIHGYSQNATNLWAVRRMLAREGRPTVGVSLRHRLAPMGWYADRLEGQMDRLADTLGDRFDVVAHSMGGVVLRIVLGRRPDLARAVGTVVTLGSPHGGTAAVRGIAWLPELAAMHRRSALLSDLPPLSDLVPHGRVVTVAGAADTVVYPTSTSMDPGAEGIVLHGVGHAGLLSHRRALATVRRALRPATPTPG